MDTLKIFYKEVINFLISTNLLESYGFFLLLMFIIIFIDTLRLHQKIVVRGVWYQGLSLVILFFFFYLYVDLFQTLNNEVLKYSSGYFQKDINISESASNYFKNQIGDSYTTGIIALLSAIFASFLKIQLIFIENGTFCKNKNNGSLFINSIIILNVFSILTFIDHLKYSEFKISEGMVMNIDNPSYFFSILLITNLMLFFITIFLYKESIFSQLINKKEMK